MKFEYWKGKDLLWYWHLRGRNGEILCASEGLENRDDAVETIVSICDGAARAKVVDLSVATGKRTIKNPPAKKKLKR